MKFESIRRHTEGNGYIWWWVYMMLFKIFENFGIHMGIYDAKSQCFYWKNEHFSSIFLFKPRKNRIQIHKISSTNSNWFWNIVFGRRRRKNMDFQCFLSRILIKWVYMMFLKFSKILRKKWVYITLYYIPITLCTCSNSRV